MPPRSTRRSFLFLAGSVSTSLAGCLTDGTRKRLAHEVEVFNEMENSQTLSVRVRSEIRETLFHREFHLEANTWEEETAPFTGTPASLTITLDGSETQQFSWPSHDCEVKSAGGGDIFLLEDGDIRIEPTCNTVYATAEP